MDDPVAEIVPNTQPASARPSGELRLGQCAKGALTMDLDGEHAVLIDPYDLEQVMLNLVINARDALPRGGAIQVSLDTATVDATYREARLVQAKAVAPKRRSRGGRPQFLQTRLSSRTQ